jgi:hypothetical protein
LKPDPGRPPDRSKPCVLEPRRPGARTPAHATDFLGKSAEWRRLSAWGN